MCQRGTPSRTRRLHPSVSAHSVQSNSHAIPIWKSGKSPLNLPPCACYTNLHYPACWRPLPIRLPAEVRSRCRFVPPCSGSCSPPIHSRTWFAPTTRRAGQLLQGRPADLPAALPGLPPARQAAGRLRHDRARRPAQGRRERQGRRRRRASRTRATSSSRSRPTDGKAEMPQGPRPAQRRPDQADRRLDRAGGEGRHAGQREGRVVDADHPPTYSAPPVVTAIDFSPDGKLLAVAGYHEVLLLQGRRLRLVARLVGLSERVQSLAFSPDGKKLAAAGGAPGRFGEVQIWDVPRSRSCSSPRRSRSTRSTA